MKIEIRSDRVTVEGYVNAVGRDSRVIPSQMGQFVEQVTPKTFERALEKGGDIELRLNHQRVLGSTSQGNLKLWEDNIGLYARAEVTDREVIEKARKKELRGWSFAFYSERDRFEDGPDGIKRRFLDEIDLREVSIIDSQKTPAYIGTSIEARGGGDAVRELRGMEDRTDTVDHTPAPDYTQAENELKLLRMKGTIK